MGIEEEVVGMVNKEYKVLNDIVDAQRDGTIITLKNLESIQNYEPPPTDFSQNTLTSMGDYIKEIKSHIGKM